MAKKDGCDNWSEGICYKVHPASDDTEDPDFWDRPWVKNPFDKIFFDDLRIKFKPSQYLSQTSVVSMQSKKPPFTVSFTIKDDANIRNSGASRNQAGHIAFGIIRVGDIQTGMEGAWKMQKFTGIHSERNRPCPWVRGKACKKYPAHAREKDVKYTIIAKPDGTVVMNDGIAGEVMTDEFVKWDGLRAKKFSPDDRFKLYFGNVVYGSGEKGEGNEVTDIEWEGTGDDTEGDKPEAPAQASPMAFLFGGQAINSVAGAILDPGNSYGKAKTPDGLDFGWLCNGNPMNGEQENSQKAGIRGNARSVYGLNHFDRNNKCRSGNTYLPVNWKIDVPPGSYKVFVLFPESRKGGCAVQGELACTGDNGKCEYDKTVTVGNDGFQITGYGHDSPTPKLQCHSVGLVRIEPSS